MEGESLLSQETESRELKECLYLEANLDLAAQDADEGARAQPDVISDAFPPAQPGDEVDIADAFEGCLHAFRDA